MELRTGGLHGPTSAATLPRPQPNAGDARAVLKETAHRLFGAMPAARRIGVRPFTYGTTEVAGMAGHYLAGMVQDTWLDAARQIVTGEPPAVERLVGTAVDPPRFVVTGTLWPVTPARVEVRVLLLDKSALRAARRVSLDTRSLPEAIRAALDPRAAGPRQGFAPLYGARIARAGRAVLEMTSDSGAAPVYRVCRQPSPETVRACDNLQFKLRANRDGVAACLSLGNDGSFGLLAPAAHYGPIELRANHWSHLPRALPADGQGRPPVWYAQGAPGTNLIACYLFRNRAAIPDAALRKFNGRRLTPREVQGLKRTLKAASPLAEAHTVVTIVSDAS
jgi:hypothetical protein